MQCSGCGGTLGRDCFNQQECVEITRDMAMRSQEQCQPEDIWQPIGTCPESEMVLLFCPEANRGLDSCEVAMVFHKNPGDPLDPFHESGRSYWTNGGPNAGSDLDFPRGQEPTHWMPLPKPPTTPA